jgi:hypothetical protein
VVQGERLEGLRCLIKVSRDVYCVDLYAFNAFDLIQSLSLSLNIQHTRTTPTFCMLLHEMAILT